MALLTHSIQKDNILLLGDTHSLDFCDLLIHYDLNNFILLGVGDHGEGFLRSDKNNIEKLNAYCSEHNGYICLIRGNHSDPEFFNRKHWCNSYENIEFVEDYARKTINNKKFLFVGGATSIDRQVRTAYRDYWPREKFVLPDNYETLEPCDILITHSSGIEEFPIEGLSKIAGWFNNDPTLKDELIQERELIQKLYNQVKPSIAHFWGHFHEANIQFINGVKQQCLDINEVVSINI